MADTILLKNSTVLVHSEEEENPVVEARRNTDVLIRGDIIVEIGENIQVSTNAQIIDCDGKIVCPGFISTHSHLWQSQLKGRHVDDTLFDYFPKGNFVSYAYEPSDTYWGQLAGGLEAVNAGTTTVLDHSHGCPTREHAQAAIQATLDSGLRSVWAYSDPTRFTTWNESECSASMDIWSETTTQMIGEFAQKYNRPNSESRVNIGLGFDCWFLPTPMIERIMTDATNGGVTTLTSHLGVNAVQGASPPFTFVKNQAPFLFQAKMGATQSKLQNFVVSHATNIPESEFKMVLSESANSMLNTSFSTTPETECQMAMCRSVAFSSPKTSGVPTHKVSLGIDCHSGASSFMPHAGRLGLVNARILSNESLSAENGSFPKTLPGHSGSDLLNSFTVNGAKALGLDHDNGGIGRIRVGRKADLIVFDAADSINIGVVAELDPITAITRFSEMSDIDIVIVDGAVRKQGKKLLPIDVETVKEAGIEGKKGLSWTEIRRELAESYTRLYARISQLNVEKARETLTELFYIDATKIVDVC